MIEAKTLTAQKYCLQCIGTGAEVTCSYGTATPDSPLIFTAVAGTTVFTSNVNTLKWMLSAAGGYVFPYVAPGASVASTAATSAGNGLAIPMDAKMLEALGTGGKFTAAALVYMGVGRGEISSNNNILSNRDAILSYIYVGSGGVIVKSYDNTTTTLLTVASWSRGEIHLKVVQTNAAGTQFRVGNRRYTSAMVPIDALTWSAWGTYDGSMNPLTHLRFGYGSTVPLGFLQTQIWAKSCTDDEILGVLRYAV